MAIYWNSPLHPKPNPETGEPRPPRAPRSGRVPFNFGTRNSETKSKEQAPDPPSGQGSTLEWNYHHNWNERIFATIVAFFGVGLAVILYSSGIITGNKLILFLFVIPLAGFALAGHSQGSSCAAGAEWLLNTKDGSWVRTYELARITASGHAADTFTFEDREGRTLSIHMNGLYANPQLWDLVYNGIRHSVIRDGAEANQKIRVRIGLPMK